LENTVEPVETIEELRVVELPVARPKPPHPCQIIFKGTDPSEAARVEVRAWLDRLGALTTPMIGGQVVIEAVDEGRREDRRYHVRMELTMPEGVVVVGPDHPSNAPHEDVYVAIRNAFRAARRQLESSVPSLGSSIAKPGSIAANPDLDGERGEARIGGPEPQAVDDSGRQQMRVDPSDATPVKAPGF
jgi:ribosome-associated translation inhibitor RaiA